MNKRKEKKILRIVKLLSILCIIILIIELSYLIYNKYFNEGESIYFDSINAVGVIDDNFVAVGSNNNNENYYEKAKISFYNEKCNKVLEKLYNKGYNSAFFGVDVFDGGIVAVGNYEATMEEKENSVRSALIVRYDKDGNVVFDEDFQILGNSKFMAVKSVDDGYFVVGQSIYEAMTIGNSNDGGAFLIKYDKNGNLEWKSNYGDSKTAIFNDLYIFDDYVYVVGCNYGNVGIIAKYDLDGELVEIVEYEYTDSFGFTSIVLNDDNIVVSGGKRTGGTDDNCVDAVLVKYDLDCNYLDEASFDNDMNERFNRVIIDNNNDLIVVGSLASYDEDKVNKDVNILKYDGIIAKYKSDLKLVKGVFYGETRDDHFTDVVVSDGNYLVSGYSSYEDNSYMSKFVVYSDALKVLEVR